MPYLWIKALHVVFVVTWFAGLFYLPRLFVYHAESADTAVRAQLKIMERRLLGITHIGGALAIMFGIATLALAVVLASDQPAARRWQASIRNNIGYALHQLGRYDEALDQFRQALKLREESGNARSVRIARWMIAWTLRSLGRGDEALAMQLALERENEAAGDPDGYVYEELEHLYRERGDTERAQHYAKKHAEAATK